MQGMRGNDAFGVRNRGRVRQRRPGRQRGPLPHRNIAYRQRDFRCVMRRRREPAAFHRRDVFPDRIDCFDWGAASHQSPMHLLNVFERMRWVQRQLHESRSASR